MQTFADSMPITAYIRRLSVAAGIARRLRAHGAISGTDAELSGKRWVAAENIGKRWGFTPRGCGFGVGGGVAKLLVVIGMSLRVVRVVRGERDLVGRQKPKKLAH